MGANSKRVLKNKTFGESMMKTVTKTKARFNLTQQARRRVALTMLICLAFGDAYALPYGEQVQAGNVAFERGAQFLNINQASQKAIVNWQSFSIAANEAVRLNQPTQGVALFRVVGSDPSQIFGSLTATGSLFLSNPNGVLFGRSAQVDVGSLVATSMRIDNDHFLAGRYQFYADGNGSVVNDGIIRTEDGGYIALLGSTVENNGLLQANNGSVVLGSAQSAILDMYGDGLVRVKLDGDALNAVIKQTGNISANGGAVQLATNARSAAINVDGVVQANSLVERNGVIRLEGGQNAKVSVNGNLSARGNLAGSKGGTIEVTGEQVALFNNAHLDASGDAGGGTVLVGGDLQGKNAQVYNARTTFVAQGATIDVSAKQNGNGGKAIIWADSATRYYGNILATGGANNGNGGFAEVSGKQYLDFSGKADLSAMNGLAGNLLLDPLNITLTTVDANTTGFTPPGDITQAFTDDAGSTSTFNVNAGGSFAGIAAGSTITLQATNNITVSSAFNVATATGSANNSLVLQANNNIAVNAAVTTSGTGSITMQADADNIWRW
jgi:filamentous hemagglutinin family protein